MKKRRHIFAVIVLSIFIQNNLYCQNAADSLLNKFNEQSADTNQVKILCNLVNISKGSNVLKYANRALTLSEKLRYPRGIARVHAYLGKYYYFAEKYSLSLEHLKKALLLAEEINDNDLKGYTCRYIGYNYCQNDPKMALDYYQKSLKYYDLVKDELQKSYAYSAIGNLYEGRKEGSNALSFFDKSLRIRQKLGSTDEIVSSLIETARGYNLVENYKYSNELVTQAIKLAEAKGKDPQNLIYLYQMIGFNYSDNLHDYKTALHYFLKSYELVKNRSSFDDNNRISLKPIAETYYQLGDYKNASAFYKLYFDLLENHQQKLNKELSNSLFTLHKEVAEKKLLYKDSEILKQKMEIQKQAYIRNLTAAGFAILLIVSFFLYRSSRLRQKLNHTLEETVQKRTFELANANKLLKEEIGERKKVEEKLVKSELKLLEANKELEAFIYKAAHDLKSPLTSSRGLVNLARESNDPQEISSYFTMIGNSLDKLDSILMSLHEVAIIRQGSIRYKKVDIEKAVNDMIHNFKDQSNFGKITFSISNRLDRPFYTDELLTQTILRNMLENAIKYSRHNIESPVVKIVIAEEGAFNVVRVSDNGIGISPEYHDKIFDVFFRATEEPKGTGLGLYIVKNAIHKLKGKIELAHSAPKEGTTFNLFFPAEGNI